jgi:hypothetical protein
MGILPNQFFAIFASYASGAFAPTAPIMLFVMPRKEYRTLRLTEAKEIEGGGVHAASTRSLRLLAGYIQECH